MKKSNFYRKKGMTLVEMLVATAIFSIVFGSVLVGQQFARQKAEMGLINYVVMTHAQGLLEAIQSYSYEDANYAHDSLQADSARAFSIHSVAFGDFDPSQSGVYSDEDETEILEYIPNEESISLRQRVSSHSADSTAFNPFSLSDLNSNLNLIGPEIDNKDVGSDPATGIFRISQTNRRLNIFGSGQEKYFFMDDVDDFDGYTEILTVMEGVPVTFQISVAAVYGNRQDYTYDVKNLDGTVVGTATIPQERFALMPSISVASIQAQVPLLASSDDSASQTQQLAYSFYSSALMKKITVKASWVYPVGSTNSKSLVIDGGKVNPRGSV